MEIKAKKIKPKSAYGKSIAIDRDVYDQLRQLKEITSRPMGEIASEILREGLRKVEVIR